MSPQYSNIAFHRRLLNDSTRMEAYRQAIHKTVQEGDVVLDIGTGCGIMAMFACQAGAKRVYAVDNADIISVAQQLAQENGYSDRIIFIKKDLRLLSLPEPVDVIVSELIANAVIGEHMEELISLCRDKFLKPGGRIIPQQVDLLVAPVQAPEIYLKLKFPASEIYDLDFSKAERVALNNISSEQLQPQHIMLNAQCAYQAQSQVMANIKHVESQLTYKFEQDGILHGFCAWFDALLAESIKISNAPDWQSTHWGRTFFPLPKAEAISPGMGVDLLLKGSYTPGTDVVVWQWHTKVWDSRHDNPPTIVAQYQQSTFIGSLISQETILKHSTSYKPVLSPSGERIKSILEWCDGKTSISDIAKKLRAGYPDTFNDISEAVKVVQELLISLSVTTS